MYKIETGGIFVYSAERCNIQAEHEPDQQEETPSSPVSMNERTMPSLAG